MFEAKETTMNFENLIGQSALLAKQLELRWFYDWEINPNHPLLKDDAKRSPKRTSSRNSSNEGKLVRKQFHKMPFLRRNAHRSFDLLERSKRKPYSKGKGKSNRNAERTKRRRSTRGAKSNRRSSTDSVIDVLSQICGKSSSQTTGSKKRKRVGDLDHKDQGDDAVIYLKTEKPPLEPMDTSDDESIPDGPPTAPLSAYDFYIHSNEVRENILDAIPLELHHDSELVEERVKASWMKMEENMEKCTSTNMAQEKSDNEEIKLDIEHYEYWVQLEKEELEDFKQKQAKYKRAAKQGQFSSGAHSSEKNTPGSKSGVGSSPMSNNAIESTMLSSTVDFPRLKFDRRKKDSNPSAYFHYLFMQPNNVPATIVEKINGRICPLCNFDGKNDLGLLRHCESIHGVLVDTQYGMPDVTSGSVPTVRSFHHFASNLSEKRNVSWSDVDNGPYFEAVLDEDSQLHVIVRGDPLRSSLSGMDTTSHAEYADGDFVFIQPRLLSNSLSKKTRKQQQCTIPFLQRPHHKAAALDPSTRKKKLLALQEKDAPAAVLSSFLPNDTIPLRQYYHSRTNLPMAQGEWIEDSDDEPDEDWLHQMSSELMQEFEDVSDKEKIFFQLWNVFIKRHHLIGDREIPGKCHEFILSHKKVLKEKGLRMNLLLHLFNLWDSGVISSSKILALMSLFDAN